MKNTIYTTTLLFLLIFSSLGLFAQLQGSGTQEDPYRIYTKSDLESIADHDTNGKHYELMNDITDSITQKIHDNFYGSFNGKGHNLVLNTTEALFKNIGASARLDSLSVSGYLIANNIMNVAPFANVNFGTINYCINNLDEGSVCAIGICRINLANAVIENCVNNYNFIASDTTQFIDYGGIAQHSYGIIRNCVNNGNITILANNKNFGGIANYSTLSNKILNCINNGTVTQESSGEGMHIGGIARASYGVIENCINNASFTCKNALAVGGIASDTRTAKIINCANYGNIYGTVEYTGGIATWSYIDSIINCLNAGNIKTSYQGEPTGVGITNAKMVYCNGEKNNTKTTQDPLYIRNCLNTGTCNLTSMIGDYNAFDVLENGIIINNYYDKQMSLPKGIIKLLDYGYICFDSLNLAEGKLTTQLVGTSPELQAMLGDGWSYAEGRYPIPLGFENDSMALAAASPVYLHFETEDNYNHVDSVTRDFTVRLENSVVWNETYGRVSFDDEYATLLSLGYENLVVNIGDYQKEVYINILDIETSIKQESISENGILYPNPASDYINIKLDGISADKLEICDISGKLILSQTITNDYQQIQIKDLKRGMYFLKIYDKNQNIKTLKFVKN